MEIKGKRTLIFGLARSGVGAANLLAHLGAEVTVTDKRLKEELMVFVKRLLPSVRLSPGGHPDEIFKDIDLIVISPGVPMDIPSLKNASAMGIKIIGELELAYQVIRGLGVRDSGLAKKTEPIPNPQSPIPFLAVTGTNGKSTTTTLLDLMLKKGGFKTILGGNIGNALSEEIFKAVGSPQSTVSSQKAGDDFLIALNSQLSTLNYIVAEVSSFQLESIDEFRPKGAAILNITPDHLDRYHSMDEYREAKAKVFLNQKQDDFIVMNADDPETLKVRREKLEVRSEKPRIYYFSRKNEVEGIYLKDGVIYCSFSHFPFPTSHFPLIKADEIRIRGVHNLENAMAASAMALLAECPLEAVIDALREFPGLEHRLEFVRELEGVRFINDSKGTNVGAVVKSLESFSEPVVLIAGGRDKAGDFSVLGPLVKERVKALILIGEAKEKIKEAIGDLTETTFAGDLREAVIISRRVASSGDVVLLSPACASFDMFRDFEDRGRQFKQIVMEMEG